MVVYENMEDGLIKAYSDAGFYIHGGMPESDYAFAIDPATAGRTYVETEEKVPEEDATVEDYEQALAKLGVE